ncbi:MAG TPA: Mpv17/PMP22 family protein [Bacteroidales bacterium]|nr:Mpv17/PMP22 family protein [Bacteroidales bacterium]HPI31422.1 Mpv17/PMP22 family protein [Bacteroidales bacterium]
MKLKDLYMIMFLAILFLPFVIFPALYKFYINANTAHPILLAMLKFGILATTGELIGLRIKTGNYFEKGFGIIPRAVVWAFLGATIAIAFKIFSVGTPACLEYLGLSGAVDAIKGDFSTLKLLTAFCISVCLNMAYAPVMMTFHKITDTHITMNHGSMKSLITPIPFAKIFSGINWDVQWNFVYKKTIPLFWFPAHTITFLLPGHFQVLFAAILGVVLGIILAVAAVMNKKK